MFSGSLVAAITPMGRDGAIDLAAWARLVDFHVENGTSGLVVGGTTGESTALADAELDELTRLAVQRAGGRLVVIAGAGTSSTGATVARVARLSQLGVDALLVVTPYYIRPPQRGLVQYYLTLAERHETPWMIYHIPGRAAVNVTLESMKEIRERSRHFVGMKHAVNDLGLVTECLAAFGDEFRIFVGLEELSFPMMAIGACGLMNAVGNLRPGVLAEVTRSFADAGISIEAILQKEPPAGSPDATVIILTQRVRERQMNAAIARIEALDAITGTVTRIRLEHLASN